MKTKLLMTLIAALTLTLTACGVKQETVDLNKWRSSRITGRSIGQREVPTAYVLDCRKMNADKTEHYYYSVIADPAAMIVQNEAGEKETLYNDADFVIEQVTQSQDGRYTKNKNLLNVRVGFKFIEKSTGENLAIVTAKPETASDLSYYYQNDPYFGMAKSGDELLSLRDFPLNNQPTNLTKSELPGLSSGDVLECR